MSYLVRSSSVQLTGTNGNTLLLSITADSGRIVTRKKVDTVFGVDHPGIIIGRDQYGYLWVAHHHYKNVVPAIERIDVYADGNQINYDQRKTYYSQQEVLQRALYYWFNVEEYKLLAQNCQHFVNIIAFDNHVSESIDGASDTALAIGGITALIGLFTGEKALVNWGLGIGIAGGVTKMINNTPRNRQLIRGRAA